MPQDLAAHYAHCEALLRDEDRDTWLAALFAPADRRPQVHALNAFFIEIRRVRDRVRQPLAGELRLQWWNDVVEGEARGDAEANPVAAALLDTIARAELSRGSLIDAIEAYRIALYGDSPATIEEFETFLDRTLGALLRSEIKVLGGGESVRDDAVRRAAAALGIADMLRHLGHYVDRNFAVIPDEILGRHGLAQFNLRGAAARPDNVAFRAVLAELRALARSHLAALQAEAPRIPASAAPAFLVVSLVEPMLRLSEQANDPLGAELTLPQWRRQWRLWRAARRHR